MGWEDMNRRGQKKSPKSKLAEVEPSFINSSSSSLTQNMKAAFHFQLYQLEWFLSKNWTHIDMVAAYLSYVMQTGIA